MRNCFIPKCDLLNKNNPKRAMFNVPIKDPVLLKQWEAVLPKHRPLKEFDRVCENHFAEDDILRYWEHTINGQVERMERKKPALRSNAVPCYIETAESAFYENLVILNRTAKIKRKQCVKAHNANKKKKMEQMEDNQSVTKNNEAEKGNLDVGNIQNKDKVDDEVVEQSVSIEVTQLATSEFEALYDDVYEVELPSTLWGIHRDLEKTFITFTEFNKDSMNIRKYLYIDQQLQYRMVVGQRIMKKGTLENVSTEALSELLSTLDKIRVQKVIIKGSSSVFKES
ncbi:uncharacterized protein LOC131425098 isoform X2 [Malaya genurostris]|uniref:uncharacterized protein LOC131425098 isoform X2 n=1 Tax=Malaya genurostris TaxID=325434 RepID=UPI0026F3E399|nr:uncharacterized protein LOC131425098 isoform X2 [Malaya genurostris]